MSNVIVICPNPQKCGVKKYHREGSVCRSGGGKPSTKTNVIKMQDFRDRTLTLTKTNDDLHLGQSILNDVYNPNESEWKNPEEFLNQLVKLYVINNTESKDQSFPQLEKVQTVCVKAVLQDIQERIDCQEFLPQIKEAADHYFSTQEFKTGSVHRVRGIIDSAIGSNQRFQEIVKDRSSKNLESLILEQQRSGGLPSDWIFTRNANGMAVFPNYRTALKHPELRNLLEAEVSERVLILQSVANDD